MSDSIPLPESSVFEQLLEIAAEEGWRVALDKIYRPAAGDYAYDWAVGKGRSDLLCVLDIGQDSQMLDIGCGWGANSIALAHYCGGVVSVDIIDATLKFLKIRSRQEFQDRNKIRLAHISPLGHNNIPFGDNSFDGAIMNGVLEWVGVDSTTHTPLHFQRAALQDVCRILRPGGQLVIGIENRFAIANWLGGRDHGNLPFTAVMPRKLGDWTTRLFQGRRFRNYLHSAKGYKKLLHESGFNNTEIYFVKPGYHQPDYIGKLLDGNVFNYWAINGHAGGPFKLMIKKVLLACRLYSLLCGYFLIVTRAAA